jgi:hypothetical protein
MSFHKSLLYTDGHVSHAFEYANASARTSASVVSADIGKIARQVDTGGFHLLVDDSPLTWLALGAGGGAGSATLKPGTSYTAPVQTIEYDRDVFFYTAGDTSSLYASLKVPSSYTAGTQVFFKLNYYSPDTSGTALMKAQTTLVRAGTDAASSTTNQYTSTNTAFTLSATANRINEVNLDCSSSTGLINSVAIAAGDELLIRIYRDTDTSTSDIRVINGSNDPKFTA